MDARMKSTGKRQQRSKPMSSHPSADSALRSLVTQSDLEEYKKQTPRRKPIVSINGEDVDQNSPVHRRVA